MRYLLFRYRLFLLIPACFIFVALLIVTAPATKADNISGDYTYTLNDDGITCTITRYNGSGGDITIPGTITDEWGTYAVTAIGNSAFDGNANITGITIPDCVTKVGDFAFNECSALQTVSLPDSINSFGSYVFCECANLININIPNNFSTINDGMFLCCNKLDNITLPDSIKSIGYVAFKQCTNLQTITIPTSVQTIGEQAFAYCTNLTDIDIPDSVKELGKGAFGACSKLEHISIPNSIGYIYEDCFLDCSSLTDLVIPEGILGINSSAFEDCINLKNVILPNSLTYIWDNAFTNCDLDTIDIPCNVSKIQHDAFWNNRNLYAVYFYGNAPTLEYNDIYQVFRNCDNDLSLYYIVSNTGFGNPWDGAPMMVFDPNVTCTVKFDLNGAGGTTPDTQKVYKGVKAVAPADPVRSGYTFGGWNNGDTKWDFNSDPVTDNITLSGDWTPNPHTVTFSTNGGSTINSEAVNFGEYVKKPTTDPIMTGYKFGGWYDGDTQWKFNSDTMPDNDITLTASWIPINYTVKYDSNGGDSGKTMDDSNFTYDVSALLRQDAFTKSGYAFTGWADTPTGDVKYTDGQSVDNLADTDGTIVTLYAVWVSYTSPVHGIFTQYLPVPKDIPTWDIEFPGVVAVDTYGNVYVTDSKSRVQKFNSNGEKITEWGSEGDGDGEFNGISGMAVDSIGDIYVADNHSDSGKYTCRMQVFSANGDFIKKWTFNVDDSKQEPCRGIAFDGDDNVYAVGRDRVVKFDKTGNYLGAIIGFDAANGVAVDKKNGFIYVTGNQNHIFKFSKDGKLLKTFTFSGKFALAVGITVDNSGYIYVSDDGRGIIQKYNSSGKVLKKWGPVGKPKMTGVDSLAADNYGNIYATDDLSVFKFTTSGKYIARWMSPTDGSGMFLYVSDVALDNQGNIYVADYDNFRIQKFDKNGTLVTKWSTRRPGDNYSNPLGVAINSTGDVYVITMNYKRIDIYDGSGNFIKSLVLGSGYDFNGTGKIAFDSDDNLYFNMDGKIQVYTKELVKADSLSCSDVSNFAPRCVAVGPDGYLYIADAKDRVIVCDKSGNLIRKWDINGGEWMFPEGIDCDADGNVYVAETDLHKIFEYDNKGNLIAQWGGEGSGINQFSYPEAVKVGPDGTVYVADENNSRIMRKVANSSICPVISLASLNTSPLLGFSPGGINYLSIKAGVRTEGQTDLKAYIYNSKGKWVAMLEITVSGSEDYTFTWDGMATAGNEAGIAAGKLVPVSSSGTKYTIKLYAENAQGSVWSGKQTIPLYTKPGVKWMGFIKNYVKPGINAVFNLQVTRFSNVEVRISDAKGNIAAIFQSSNMLPNRNVTVTWDGKATEGNTLGLSAGSAISPGKYYIQITAGSTVYKVKKYVTVY